MIAPTKGIAPQRALLSIAAQIAMTLDEPMTVSQAWSGLKEWRQEHNNTEAISFAWFVLGLDVLFALRKIEIRNGLIVKSVTS